MGFFETDGGAFPILDLQCELVARLIQARTSAPGKAERFARRLAGPAPAFDGGLGYLDAERMANYVRTRPYESYLKAAIRELT